MNKNIYYYAIIILLITGTYFYTNMKYTIDEDFFKEMLEERKQESYSGIVIKKYVDESGKYPVKMLRLKDNTIAKPGKDFWKTISVGDSIVKIEGADFVTLYKKDNTKISYSYKDQINKMMKEELSEVKK